MDIFALENVENVIRVVFMYHAEICATESYSVDMNAREHTHAQVVVHLVPKTVLMSVLMVNVVFASNHVNLVTVNLIISVNGDASILSVLNFVVSLVITETGVDWVMINHAQNNLDADILVLGFVVNVALQSVTSAKLLKRKSIKYTAVMNLRKVPIIATFSLKFVDMYLLFKL